MDRIELKNILRNNTCDKCVRRGYRTFSKTICSEMIKTMKSDYPKIQTCFHWIPDNPKVEKK